MNSLRLAADTNVLLDEADGVEDVLDALELIAQRFPESDWLVTPTVLDELAFLSDFGQSSKVRASAYKAMRGLREHQRFRSLLELPFPPQYAHELAEQIRRRGILPPEEVNDALILAESALLECTLLLTSDEHLRAIALDLLTLTLNPYGVAAPVIATPREIVRKFLR